MGRTAELLGIRTSIWLFLFSLFALAGAYRYSERYSEKRAEPPTPSPRYHTTVDAALGNSETPSRENQFPNDNEFGTLPQSILLQLSDPDVQIRQSALRLLPTAAPPNYDPVPVLTACLNDVDPSMRAAAAEQLGLMRMTAAAAVPRLKELATADPDEVVQSRARDALYNIRLYDFAPTVMER